MLKNNYVTEKAEVPRSLEGFKNWEFSSGGTTEKDFDTFARLFRLFIKKNLKKGMELVNFGKGHYYLSGFIKRNSNFVYFSFSDVRYFPGEWYENILIRTARNEQDYTGGGNCSSKLQNLFSEIERLTD